MVKDQMIIKKVQFEDVVKSIIALNIIVVGIGSASSIYIPIPFFDYIVFVMMGLAVFILVLANCSYRKNLYVGLENGYLLFTFTWFILGILSLIFNFDHGDVRIPIYLSSIIAIFFSFCIYLGCRDLKDFKLYLKAYLISLFLNYGFSVNEIFFGKHITEPRSVFQMTSTYVGFSNQNNYATFLIYTTILLYLLYELRDKNSKFQQLLYCGIIVVNFILCIVTGSKAGVLAQILILFMFFVKKIMNIDVQSIKIIVCLVLALYVVFVVIAAFGILPDDGERFSYINKIVPSFWKNFVLGLGPGGNVIENDGWVHNLSFEILFDYGIVVFLFFINMLVKTINKFIAYLKFEMVFVMLLLPIIWISSSSALSLHFTWTFMSLFTLYPLIMDENTIKSE
ncbi:hypothetical protein E5329_23750 [Petralouisia muris]|uniref:Uncharacterized protein n=1 Tax=Petralouisia muris TaxID=3032872 RepID=A0AC61RPJ3_9FIRM|nr:hypothetical protein [Petralouisia muris]TGY90907.1 hypothetical protein E5329_23750 [Petralouisia muris]